MPHIIPFKGRNHSGVVTQNLLWQDGNAYLMDNHRAALWCWQQQIDLYSELHSLIHIDRHYDTLDCELAKLAKSMPDLRGLSIDDYLQATVKLDSAVPLFRWDNYLSLYLEAVSPKLDTFRCLTQQDGDKPKFAGIMESPPEDLPENFDYWLSRGKWIVNIDIDYFFCPGRRDDEFIPMYSERFLDDIFAELRAAMDRGTIAVFTLCLTPSNFTPGWQACLELSERIFNAIGRDHPEI